MAHLQDLISSKTSAKGRKRRSWLADIDENSQTINKEISNGNQTVNKEISNGNQTVNKEISNGNQMVNKEILNGNQTVNNWSYINQFTGTQKDILFLMFNNIENKIKRVTCEIRLSLIETTIGVNKQIAKQAIYRCKEKGVINISERKDGRGGWCKYSLSKNIYDSIYNNIIYNNKENIQSETPSSPKVEEINFDVLKKYGFKRSHITQLSKIDGLTEEMVQESIYHYAWALDNNFEEMKRKYDSRFEKNPLGLLIGTLKKGHEWIEAGYKSPEEIAEEQIFIAKRERLERIKKRKS